MSNERTKIGDSVEVDLAWSSDLRDAHADEDGETVDVPGDESEGDVRTVTRPDIKNWDELADKEKTIIAAAADPTEDWDSLSELKSDVGTTVGHASRTLRKHAPELHRKVKQGNMESGERYGAEFTDFIRRELLDGGTISDIKNDTVAGKGTIRRHAKSEINADETTEPRLQYDHQSREWQPVEAVTEQSERHNEVDQNQMTSAQKDTTDSNTESEPDASGDVVRFSAPDCVPGSACAICQDFYSEREWEFCPFCGNRLLRMPDTEVNNE
jgi:hypothetical protein